MKWSPEPRLAETRRLPKAVAVLAGLTFLLGPMSAVARQGVVPLLFAAVLALAFLPDARKAWRSAATAPLVFFAAPFFLWALISNIWAPQLQLLAWGQMMLTVTGATLLAVGLNALDGRDSHAVNRGALAGGVVLAVFLLEESLSQAAFLSWVRPEDVQSSVEMFFSLIMSLAARGTAVLAIIAVPLAILVFAETRSRLWPVLLLIAGLVACARLPMTTSAVGLAAACIAAALVYARPKPFLTLMLVAIAVMTLSAGPLSRAIPAQPTFAAQTQLELGVQHRLGIWRHVGGLIAQQPVVGHGFNAARHYAAQQDKIEGLGLPALPTHPHNAPLQIWLELGGVGALLVALAGFGIWRALRPLWTKPHHAALAAGVLAPACVVACFSFSVWSTWWLAALGWAAGFCILAMKAVPPERP